MTVGRCKAQWFQFSWNGCQSSLVYLAANAEQTNNLHEQTLENNILKQTIDSDINLLRHTTFQTYNLSKCTINLRTYSNTKISS
jgi:hypothetical protein